MQALTFWKTITVDHADLLERLVAILSAHSICYCVIGGQAVNAYAEPVVSLDLDLVIAVDQVEMVQTLLVREFDVRQFAHSLNVSAAGSDLRVQIQTDPRYGDFVDRAQLQEVLGLTLPVAAVEDVLQGKVWAALDVERRASRRQKDLADIARILEGYPQLRARVPIALLERLL